MEQNIFNKSFDELLKRHSPEMQEETPTETPTEPSTPKEPSESTNGDYDSFVESAGIQKVEEPAEDNDITEQYRVSTDIFGEHDATQTNSNPQPSHIPTFDELIAAADNAANQGSTNNASELQTTEVPEQNTPSEKPTTVNESPNQTGIWTTTQTPSDAPNAEISFEELLAQSIPAEETPAEETPAEETPAEETPAEETPAEETPEEVKPEEVKPEEVKPAEVKPAEVKEKKATKAKQKSKPKAKSKAKPKEHEAVETDQTLFDEETVKQIENQIDSIVRRALRKSILKAIEDVAKSFN